jgi:hypothetical protein
LQVPHAGCAKGLNKKKVKSKKKKRRKKKRKERNCSVATWVRSMVQIKGFVTKGNFCQEKNKPQQDAKDPHAYTCSG